MEEVDWSPAEGSRACSAIQLIKQAHTEKDSHGMNANYRRNVIELFQDKDEDGQELHICIEGGSAGG